MLEVYQLQSQHIINVKIFTHNHIIIYLFILFLFYLFCIYFVPVIK